jgi:hypothetical protein
MTNVAEPRPAAWQEREHEQESGSGSVLDGELTSLVRRWISGSRAQERARRQTVVEVVPDAEPPARVGVEVDSSDPSGPEEEQGAGDEAQATLVTVPRLPQRGTVAEADQLSRTALLVDARRVPADAAAGLLARVAERGPVNVCRAYGDWSTPELGEWAGRLRREGLHSFHHFSDEDDRALVAMAIDAVDIARDAAVDEVVIAGDLTSVLPLVHRLHGAGVRVVAVGAAHTPHDIRAACDEFIDIATLDGDHVVPVGRHRA